MSRNDDMTVRFSGLKPGRYHYLFTLDDAFFEGYENEELKGGNVKIEADLERLEHTLVFTFRLEGELKTWCDRCLGDMSVPVEGEERLCVKFGDGEQSDDEEVAVLAENASEIDLRQWLYEYAAVRMPMQHMHPEGECDPSMTALIASDEQIAEARGSEPDPRWEALKKLK